MLLRLAWRELRCSWRFALFFIFNLSLGLTGFVSLEAFKDAIQTEISANARALLGADISVSARRNITDEELRRVHGVLGAVPESVATEFFAMLNSAKGSRLVSVKAVDDLYPFYGTLDLGSGHTIHPGDHKDFIGKSEAWVYPELLSQMSLNLGDTVELGNLKLTLTQAVVRDATQTFRAASLAPRIFIDRKLLPRSGLIQFGSTFSIDYLYKLSPKSDPEAIRTKLFDVLPDPAVQVDTPQSAGEDSGRQLAYLSDYLGLVAIIALFMSVLGASYIFRLYLSRKLKEIAILRALGLQSGQAVGIYVWQLLILGAASSLVTIVLAMPVLPLLSALLNRFTPFDLQVSLNLTACLISLLLSILASFVVSFPFLFKIYDLHPQKLFSEEKFSVDISVRRFWPFLPGVLMFWGLSLVEAHSWSVGSYFVAALGAVLAVLVLWAWVSLKILSLLRARKFWFVKFSLLGLSRRRAASFAIFVAMGLGALLMNVLPQLKVTLQREFSVERGAKLPSLFMFDIQDEQLSEMKKFVHEQGLEFTSLSPLVRARILKVNGKDFERQMEGSRFRTREEEREARFRNRGVNLSYRPELSPSEAILRGRAFSTSYDPQKKAELSVEYKFAERLGLHLGDQLLFDVQGVEVEGQVVNLRTVKWTSFQPNFFILIQDGALNEAPKTYIASVPPLSPDAKARLQNQLAQRFPNVSVIDVGRAVETLLSVADQMSWSLELMAALALLTGYIVLYSIVRAQIRLRRWELNMLKVLGASWRDLVGFILVESFALSFLSSVAGALLSLVVSAVLAVFVFDAPISFNLFWPLLSVMAITFASLFVAVMASFDVIRESPLGILQNEG